MNRRGFTYVELLAGAVLVAIVAAAAAATWSIAVRAPGNKRVTEMGAYVATQEIERLKAAKYLSLPTTPANAPLVAYYDRYGVLVAGAAALGYKTKAWITALVDRDGIVNTEDLIEIRVEVWDNGETRMYERTRTLLTFGGI